MILDLAMDYWMWHQKHKHIEKLDELDFIKV